MNIPLQLRANPAHIDNFRALCADVGISQTDAINHILALFLGHPRAPEILRRGKPAPRVSTVPDSPRFTPATLRTLAGVTSDFEWTEKIRARTGQGEKVAWRGLRQLTRAGLVECDKPMWIDHPINPGAMPRFVSWRLVPRGI